MDDNIKALTLLQEKDISGVMHMSSPEKWSRYDLARTMAELLDVDQQLVEKISLDDLNEPFQRPKNTSLSVDHLLKTIDIEYTDIKSCMQRVAQRWKEWK